VLLLALVTVALVPRQALGDVSGLAWADDTAIRFPMDGSASEKRTAVNNDTGRTITGTVTSSDPELVQVRPAKLVIGPGEAASLTMSVSADAANADTATLTVVADPAVGLPAGAVIRRPVTVGPLAKPVPTVDTVIAVSRWGAFPAKPWLRDLFATSTEAELPLKSPGSCNLVDPATLSDLGQLRTDNGLIANVSATCADIGDVPTLQLSFASPGEDRLRYTGATFSGKLDLSGSMVSVTVRRTSGLLLPIITLAAGLAAALFVLARKPMGMIGRLRRRLGSAADRIGTPNDPGPATVAFREAAGSSAWGNFSLFDDLAERRSELDRRLDALGGVKRFTLADDDAEYTKIANEIAQIEASTDNLEPLAEELRGLEAKLPFLDATGFIPGWIAQTRSDLLTPTAATVASIPQRLADARSAHALALAFPAVAMQLQQMGARLSALAAVRESLKDSERDSVDSATGVFANTCSDLALAGSNAELRDVCDHGVKDARLAVAKLINIGAGQHFDIVQGGGGPAVGDVSVALPDDAVPPVTSVAAERVRSLLAVVLIAILLVCAGLQTLVIGKPFGTPWDFVQAFAWGAASTAVAAPLVSAWETYITNRADPPSRSGANG
jgi:hypothetical protein